MKQSSRISDIEKWQAVISCDSNYDGIFFYGVQTTGIFCRPSCKSKTPLHTNVIFFDSIANALETGLRPCKRCCPDKVVFQPDLKLVKEAKDTFDVGYKNPINIAHISKQLGVSTNHLIKLFKEHYGFTPSQYIVKIRVDKAAELLNQKDISIIDIAYMTGFMSLSNFYKCFKQQIGYTPNDYRKNVNSIR